MCMFVNEKQEYMTYCKRFFDVKRIFVVTALCLCSVFGGFAQIDTVFWFAPPDLEINHQQTPIQFCFTTYNSAATITVEQPTNSVFPTTTFTVPADSFYVLDISNWVEDIESKPANTVLNRGFRISSTAYISCYYESVGNNSEMYTLKGSSGLGTDFLVPMQVFFNSAYSSSTSSIEIIATENNTVVQITAPVALQGGIAADSTVTVTLQRGQTYVIRSAGTSASDHLHNTVIHSNNPIVVNSTDDSVESTYGCADLIGEQLVPVNMTGLRYVAIRNYSSYDNIFERVFVFPLQNNTTVWFNGVPQTVSQGSFIDHPLTDTATLITSNLPVAVFQITATGCEQGGTMLPHLECTGSYSVSHLRPNIASMIVTLVTETIHTGSFTLNGNPNAITAADFHLLAADPSLSYCLKDISSIVPTGTVMTLTNSSGRFQLGILDGDNGGSCSYGFFSDYARSSYVRFEMDSLYCVGDSIVFQYSAPNVDSLVFTGPNGVHFTTPPFVFPNANLSMTGWYYLNGVDTSSCFTILSDSIYVQVVPCEDSILPDNVDSADCTFLPEGTEWSIAQPIISANSVLTVTTPMVGDIDDDGEQEILIPDGYYNMIIFHANGIQKTQFSIAGMYGGGPVGNIAIAKVKWQNNAYKNIIVVFGTNKHLYAYDANGIQLWQSSQSFSSYNGEQYPLPTISFADFNHDGWTEVYVGAEIYDAATGVFLGKAVGNKGCAGRTWDTQANPYQTIAADLYGDNALQMAIGNSVFSVDIQSRTDASLNNVTAIRQVPSSLMVMEDNSAIPFTDGNTALVDINNDGHLDVLVMNVDQTNRVIYCYIWDVATQTIICSKKIPNARKFGCPLVGDIDNDGNPEICFIVGTYDNHNTGDNDLIYALKYNASNQNGEMDIFWTIPHGDDSGCTGLTSFDFNQDGYVELVYRDISHLRIINGSLHHHQTGLPVAQPYDMANFSCVCSTQIKYPIVADVDLDGEAEIIVGGGNASTWVNTGHLYIFKSASTPWAPARPVWNQYMYNVTNVNEDLTIPQYLFNNATPFTDPQGVVRRPFNNFLQQATTIDQYGRPFYAVPDVAVNPSASSQLIGYDTLALTFSYCNMGDNTLNAPYPITVFANAYGGDTLGTVWINQSLPVDSCVVGEIRLPTNMLCGIQNLDSLVIAVNCAGTGIAQNGSLQPECDTTNNTVTLSIEALSVSVTLEVEACDSYTWNGTTYHESGIHTLMFTNTMGCDSIVTLQLTINHSVETENYLTLCDNDLPYTYGDTLFGIGTSTDSTYIFHRTTVHGCDSTSTLHLTVNPTSLTEYADSVCQNMAYSGFGFSLSEDETATSGLLTLDRTLSNHFGCDSVIRLNLYVKPVITPVFFANPDRAMLSENPVIHFVNVTNTVELAQANYYWVWDFGDGTSDTTSEANTEHLYTQWGDYTVTLTLWADGCVDSASVTVFIEADLEFPNVITPNGDGINDVFVIKNLNPDRPNQLYITDRWGKAVWSQKNYQTYMKDEQIYNAESGFGMGNISDGVYYYTFYYEGAVRTVKFNGSITVIR